MRAARDKLLLKRHEKSSGLAVLRFGGPAVQRLGGGLAVLRSSGLAAVWRSFGLAVRTNPRTHKPTPPNPQTHKPTPPNRETDENEEPKSDEIGA